MRVRSKNKKKHITDKKRHIIKSQLIINEKTTKILHCEVELEGAKSDVRIFRETPLSISGKIKIKGDLGYQGIDKIHSNSKIPIKKPKNGELTKKQKKKNKRFRGKRVKVEHVIAGCKNWRIVKETYRNHRRHIKQVWLLICGMVNFST